MVMGDRHAVVKTQEGPKSPMFLAQSCEGLKLVSGRALASWVGADGKPHLVPITPQGPSAMPGAGQEERSARAVWVELSSRREVQKPAVMRGASSGRPERTYVPESGLGLEAPAGAVVRVTLRGAAQDTTLPPIQVGADGRFKLTRQHLPADTRVLVAWTSPADAGGNTGSNTGPDDEADRSPLWLHTLPQAEQADLDTARQQIRQQVKDPLQQVTLDSMLYEQRQLPLNLRHSLADLKAIAAVNGSILPRP